MLNKTYLPTFSSPTSLINAGLVAILSLIANEILSFIALPDMMDKVVFVGIIVLIVLLINYLIPKFSNFDVLNWSVGKQLGLNLATAITAILAIYAFGSSTNSINTNFKWGATAGILLSVVWVLFNQGSATRKIENVAGELASSISKPFSAASVAQNGVTSLALSNAGSAGIKFLPNQIIMAQASAGGVELFSQDLKGVQSANFPISINALKKDLESYGHFEKLNEDTIVNLNAIQNIEKDGSGLKVTIAKIGKTYPVTLSYAKALAKRLA